MDFPFETTTKDGRKATVLGTMPDGRLIGFVPHNGGRFISWDWGTDGSSSCPNYNIALPLQIKPLTTYRMRNGEIAWTSGLIRNGWIFGFDADGKNWRWRVADGRWSTAKKDALDLIEELPPGTTE